MTRFLALAGLAATAIGCAAGAPDPHASAAAARPSILLVTLDTTRADAIGPEAKGVATPAFTELARRGRLFRQAYAAVPETLPSHASMMTGLYPAGHAVHENGRFLAAAHAVAAERLRQAGYATAAFVSSFALARRFGLARGFDVYDDELRSGRAERTAVETTEKALQYLSRPSTQPRFVWVHYYDPHAPYEPPEPFRTRYAARPYLGEVAAMDEQLGRLARAFEERSPAPAAILVVADHGEGLGDHGEPQHGSLLYQSTIHVPLLLIGPGVVPGMSDAPVSTRRVFHTLLDWAGLDPALSLRGTAQEVVLGEAMKPFLQYGWQPQVMAVEGRQKTLSAGRLEVYDVLADPEEAKDLASSAELSRPVRNALREYPLPSLAAARAPDTLSPEARQKLASLGYVSAGATPVIRKDAPRPADETRLLEMLERASGLFVGERYAEVIPLYEKVLAEDPHNLDAVLRLATAHSALGHEQRATALFEKAEGLAPESPDVRTYLALHYARGPHWERAVPMLERIVSETPERLAALEALAVVRERQGRVAEGIALRQSVYALRTPSVAELLKLGQLAMSVQETPPAIDAFERARAQDVGAFQNDLELGVLYLAARRLPEARDALDRVSLRHPGYPMALFKRAQVSVLLNEADKATRIAMARQHADATTRGLIERERLFDAVR